MEREIEFKYWNFAFLRSQKEFGVIDRKNLFDYKLSKGKYPFCVKYYAWNSNTVDTLLRKYKRVQYSEYIPNQKLRKNNWIKSNLIWHLHNTLTFIKFWDGN